MHKGQPGNQLSVQAGARELKMKSVKLKINIAPAWPTKLNPGQAFVRKRYLPL